MVILIILNLIIFLYYFQDQSISRNISDWANFASYIGGITSVLISSMTLLVTIFIAYEISKIDENRHIANLEFENKKFIRELREKKYAEVSDNLNSFWIAITNKNGCTDDLYVIRTRFLFFIKYKNHLFPKLNPSQFKPIDDILIEIMYKSEQEELVIDSPLNLSLIEKFRIETNYFHKVMQEYIISNK